MRGFGPGKPPLRPDLSTLPHPHYLNSHARWIRERKLQLSYTRVVALLVSQRSPGEAHQFEMRGKSLSILGYKPILDPTDVFGGWEFREHNPQPIDVDWRPDSGKQGALVPLFLMHYLGIVPGKETRELRSALFGVGAVITGNVIAPRTLDVRGARRQDRDYSDQKRLERTLATGRPRKVNARLIGALAARRQGERMARDVCRLRVRKRHGHPPSYRWAGRRAERPVASVSARAVDTLISATHVLRS